MNKPVVLFAYTDEQLRAELERRAQAASLPYPTPFLEPDMRAVISLAKRYVDGLQKDEHVDDFAEYIFEAAITAVYGAGVWQWINAKQR